MDLWLHDIESLEAVTQDEHTKRLCLRMAAMSQAGTLGPFIATLHHDDNLDDSTKLTYNPATGLYEVARLFKQGFYNYKYVLLRPNGILDEGFVSGNFDETENEYTVIIYYRPVGGRYDRIIGKGSANSIDITN